MTTRRVVHAPGLVVALAAGLSVAACTNDAPHPHARSSAHAHPSATARPSATASSADEALPDTPASWCRNGTPGASSGTGKHHGRLHDDFNGDGYSDVAFPVACLDEVRRPWAEPYATAT